MFQKHHLYPSRLTHKLTRCQKKKIILFVDAYKKPVVILTVSAGLTQDSDQCKLQFEFYTDHKYCGLCHFLRYKVYSFHSEFSKSLAPCCTSAICKQLFVFCFNWSQESFRLEYEYDFEFQSNHVPRAVASSCC